MCMQLTKKLISIFILEWSGFIFLYIVCHHNPDGTTIVVMTHQYLCILQNSLAVPNQTTGNISNDSFTASILHFLNGMGPRLSNGISPCFFIFFEGCMDYDRPSLNPYCFFRRKFFASCIVWHPSGGQAFNYHRDDQHGINKNEFMQLCNFYRHV